MPIRPAGHGLALRLRGAPVFPVAEDVPMDGDTVAPRVLRSGRPVRVDDYAALSDDLPFVVAEALTNVGKYARASHAAVAVRLDGERLEVEVRDDGIGGGDASRARDACARAHLAESNSAFCTTASHAGRLSSVPFLRGAPIPGGRFRGSRGRSGWEDSRSGRH